MVLAWDPGKLPWHWRGRQGRGKAPGQPAPHARHSRRPHRRSAQPRGATQGPWGPHLRLETEMARGQARGHSAWGGKWTSATGFRLALHRGSPAGRLLHYRSGSISRDFLHVSITLSLGRGGRGGLRQGQRREWEEGRVQGGSAHAAAGLSHRDAPAHGASGYLSSAHSGMPASARAARNCARTPRTLLMNPLESGKRGKPMSG